MIDARVTSPPHIRHFDLPEGIQYPNVSDYDCIAETVVIVYRLSLACLGHVVYSLAGCNIEVELDDKDDEKGSGQSHQATVH